jgi:hypothetical protein
MTPPDKSHLVRSSYPGSTADRVREALANVRLDGLNPDPRAIELLYLVADGTITADMAVAQICSWYTRQQTSSS